MANEIFDTPAGTARSEDHCLHCMQWRQKLKTCPRKGKIFQKPWKSTG